MKSLLFIVLLPIMCFAQSHGVASSAPGYSAESNTGCIHSSWQVMARPTLRNPLNLFYRFTSCNGKPMLELKLSAGGVPFVVAKNAPLELYLENGNTITLINEYYAHSAKGWGSRVTEANIQGVTLQFLLNKEIMEALYEDYLSHITLFLADCQLGSPLTLRRSETFSTELLHFYHTIYSRK